MESKGKLIVSATYAKNSLPVYNALVLITKKEKENKKSLIAVRTTDISGKTLPLTVNTPPLSLSLDKNNNIMPYTPLDIKIYHKNAIKVEIEDVQIFPENTSILKVYLTPLPEDNKISQKEIYKVIPQDLY